MVDDGQAKGNAQPVDPVQGQSDEEITDDMALPEDNDTPFTPANDPSARLGEEHQTTDNASNIDSHELYDEGRPGAAEAAEPDDPGIAAYTPPSDGATDEDNQSDDEKQDEEQVAA